MRATLARDTMYEIRVDGELGAWWQGWFDEGLTLTSQPDGTTLMVGPLADQAALYGLLLQLRDAGVALLSIRRMEGG